MTSIRHFFSLLEPKCNYYVNIIIDRSGKMTYEELVYKLFGIQQEEIIDSNLLEVKEKLTKQKDKLSIEVREVELEDPKRKQKEPTYLDDELLKFTENGISILHVTDKVSEMLIEYIPRTVKELTIPAALLKDLSILLEFPNLETLHISDYSYFTKEDLKYIEQNTHIKNLSIRSAITLNRLKGQLGFNIIDAGNIIGQVGNLTIYHTSYNGKWKPDIKIYPSEYNKKNLAIIDALYNGISSYLPEVSSVAIFNKNVAMYKPDFDLTVKDGMIQNMSIKEVPPTNAAQVYKSIQKKAKVQTTQYSVENKSYSDIYQLKEMEETTDLTMRYKNDNFSTDASYQEFLNMRATIDYYKELIETSNLSPVEQIAFVYDILKTMRYQSNKKDKSRARNIHSIVTDGNIVCSGYASFAKQLLTELGIRCLKVSVTCLEENTPDVGHARNFVRVDDDKYNIHGLFAMDITWDSDKDISVIEEDNTKTVVARPDEEQQKKVVDKYNSLILYRHFLIPMETYESRYPQEINPAIYETYKAGNAKRLVDESRKIASKEMSRTNAKNIFVLEQHEALFDIDEGPLTVQKYFWAPKPSLETFEQILTVVRQAEGYSKEATEKEVDRVVELHEMLAKQNPDRPNHFFKSSTK